MTGRDSKRVMVAMSGGVDSSVAAMLLLREGYDVSGVTMSMSLVEEDGARKCCGPEDISDAKRVCDQLGIEHRVLPMNEQMERHVIEPFIAEYGRGRTPNPCILCNERIKFGYMLDRVTGSGGDLIATGHYAATTLTGSVTVLARPRDREKDQTYFLYSVDRARLGQVIFPLADMTKEEVRAIASEAGLPVSRKRESQDVCFWPAGGGRAFFEGRIL